MIRLARVLVLMLAVLAVGCTALHTWPDLTRILAVHHVNAKERIIWMHTPEDAHELCVRRGSIAVSGHHIAGCYDPDDDVIVLHIKATREQIDHEYCHRFG